MSLPRLRPLLVATAIVLTACSGSSDKSATTTTSAPPAAASTTTSLAATSTSAAATTTAAPTTTVAPTTTTTVPTDVPIEDTLMDLYANWPVEYEAPSDNHQRALVPADGDVAPGQLDPSTDPSTATAYVWVRGVVRDVQLVAQETASPDAAVAAGEAAIAAAIAVYPTPVTVPDDGNGWHGFLSYAENQFGGQSCHAELVRAYGFRMLRALTTLQFCPEGTDIAAQLRLVTAKQDAFLAARGITPTTTGAGFRDAARRYGADDALLLWPTIFGITGISPDTYDTRVTWTSSSMNGVFGTGQRSAFPRGGGRPFAELRVDQAYDAFGLDSAAAVADLPAARGLVESAGGFPGGQLFVGTDGNPNALVVFVQGNRRYSASASYDDPAQSVSVAVALATAQRERLGALGFSDSTTPTIGAPVGSTSGVKVEELLPNVLPVWPAVGPAPSSVSFRLGRRAMTAAVDPLLLPAYAPVAAAELLAAANDGSGGVSLVVAELPDAAAATAWLAAFTAPPAAATVARPGGSVTRADLADVGGWKVHSLTSSPTPGPLADLPRTTVVLARVAGTRVAVITARATGTAVPDGLAGVATAFDALLDPAAAKPGAGDTAWPARVAALRERTS